MERGGGLNDTDGEEAWEQRENGRTAGDREPGRLRESCLKRGNGKKRETGGPEPPSDGKDSKPNIDGTESRFDEAAVRGTGKSTTL